MINGPRLQLKPSYQGLPDLVKDLREILAATPDQTLVEVTGQFIEGLTLKLPTIPRVIELVRCVNPKGSLTNHGTAVEWSWIPAGARIDRIDGLAVGSTTYDFTFRVTYG